MRARNVKEVSLTGYIFTVRIKQFITQNITSVSSSSVWEWYGGWIYEMILLLPSCPFFTALSYTSLLYSVFEIMFWIPLLRFLGFLCFPWKIGHGFPWISWILVNFYISWYLLVSPCISWSCISTGISWCSRRCISTGISWCFQKLYSYWYLLVFPEVVYLLVSPGVFVK